ncbi:cation-translocating P-type ATPase [Guyparkeria sp. GHLCS8-2]|uniref:heavy metal translocating P-type ATPase n=1 Tax=Guyparkeria halopsychrophila TaxID=3139421 RepID=UPI0037CA1986
MPESSGRALVTIEGLWCPSCAAATEQLLRDTPGVHEASVSFLGSAALLRWDPDRITLSQIADKVRRLGYQVTPRRSDRTTRSRLDERVRTLGIRLTLAAFFGVWTMLFSLLIYLGVAEGHGETTGWWLALTSSAFALPVLAVAGVPVFVAGWRTLRTGVPGMDTLVTLGVAAAVVLSAWHLAQGGDQVYSDTAVMLIVLITVGRLLEALALRRAAMTIDALHARMPELAERLVADGTTETVAAEAVSVGDRIRVPAGQRLPLDGIVEDGITQLDRSVMTGESCPVTVHPGDQVAAGNINLDRVITVRVGAAVGERAIDRIGERVIETVRSRPSTQRLADRFAGWIAPTAIGLASLTAFSAWLLGLSPEDALLRATSVLVVACPCALSIAVPIAYVSLAGRAADEGILFRDAAALEQLAEVSTLYLDKTGTLTQGRPAVSEVILRGHPPAATHLDAATVIKLAAAAEDGVDHVIAAALRRAAGDVAFTTADTHRHETGVAAFHPDWGRILVGSPRLLHEHGVPIDALGSDDLQVEVAIDHHWVATIVFDDPVRKSAAPTIGQLQQAGVACGLITGDRQAPAMRVAAAVGLSPHDVQSGCLPNDKARLVRSSARPVAFVGDGANDSLALANADVGIAVANANSTAAMAADVVLGNDGVDGVSRAITLAREGRHLMRQNLGFAIVYNGLGLTLAAAGAIPPVIAATAMAASSLTVILNAARFGWSLQAPLGQPRPAETPTAG